MTIFIRAPELADETAFIQASLRSETLHHPWTSAPKTHEAYQAYLSSFSQPSNKSFLVMSRTNEILGVFNLSEIVRGCFQNSYLGYYAFSGQEGKGYMSQGMKLVLDYAFNVLALHRVEANIQPGNVRSIYLVQKNGFRKEGYSLRYLKINDEWRDHERWALTAEEWKR
ncbi:GNAT family N-acetyltransferase [Aquicella lusitana]|uniref:RimJ/RimL family protein N-acetyltransferase n=1 Tax=Aquicella lusitana TaxID=254246 RepID=A0A370GYV8_9COXI|nr:GNAT family N-acetyltransferase [Aquicella lusitana]RDI48848.1 RimJ/RimL family protein N-acetyltransferase [Aquicella lusitana]VVC73276.1 hypothetical protein AQULUS_10110 [Aquicella lusitana]